MDYIKLNMKVYARHHDGLEDNAAYIFPITGDSVDYFNAFNPSTVSIIDDLQKVVNKKINNDTWNFNNMRVKFDFTPMTQAEVLAHQLNSKFNDNTVSIPVINSRDVYNIPAILSRMIDDFAVTISDLERDDTLGV